MEGTEFAVPAVVRLVPSQSAGFERRRGLRVRHLLGPPPEGGEFSSAPLADGAAELGVFVVGEVLKRRRRAPLFALEQHGRERPQQNERGRNPQPRVVDEHAQPVTGRAIAHLVVILRVADEAVEPDAVEWPAVAPLAEAGILPPVDEAVFQRVGEVVDPSEVGVVTGSLAGEQRVQRVMEVVGPLGVDAVATERRRTQDAWVVQVALGYQHVRRVDRARQLFE